MWPKNPLPTRRIQSGMQLMIAAAFLTLSSRAETVEGFVTKIGSQADFYLSSRHVVMIGSAQCTTETLETYITWGEPRFITAVRLFEVADRTERKTRKALPCASALLTIGSRVQISGDATGPDGSFLATQVTFYKVKINHLLVPDSMNRSGNGGALLEEPPLLKRAEKGWIGTVWLDGYPMAITPSTELLTAPSGTKLSYRPPGSHVKHPKVLEGLRVPALKASRWDAVMPNGPVLPFTASSLQPNTFAVYQGAATLNGQVPLESIRLWENEVDEDEQKYLAGLMPVIRDPDYEGHIRGAVGFQGEGKQKSVEILADEDVQKYVTALGLSLVPEYQRALPEQDKTKVHFRFYIVHDKRPSQDDEMETSEGVGAWSPKRLDAGAVAFPSGIILLPDYILARIGNEAQLAAILSDEITTVLQKHGYIANGAWSDLGLWEHLMDPLGDYDYSALVLPLLRSEQTLRIGTRQLYLAGYDICEAPIAWAAAAGRPANWFPKKRESSERIPWYTAYSFDYISRFYPDVDCGKLKRGDIEYAHFLDRLRKADPEAFVEAK